MKNEAWEIEQPIKRFNYLTAGTDELKDFIGSFERELDTFRAAQPPEKQSFEWFLHNRRAISGGYILKGASGNLYVKNYAVCNISLWDDLNKKMCSLLRLKDKRDAAKKFELRELEKSAPPEDDEINVNDIPF